MGGSAGLVTRSSQFGIMLGGALSLRKSTLLSRAGVYGFASRLGGLVINNIFEGFIAVYLFAGFHRFFVGTLL